MTIRRATSDDADFIAWTILAAQRGHRPRGWFDIALDWPETRCRTLVKSIATHRQVSCWHVSTFWIAEIDGAAAAALCAVPASGVVAAQRAAMQQALHDAGIDPAEQAAISRRGAYVRSCWMPGDDANWFIEHVATTPACRGRGLTQALLAHALAEGARAGHTRTTISFYIGNDVAERCYAKAGFVFAEERRDPEFEVLTGTPGFRRFERAV
ncbi:acetyltransferase [Rhodopseudomonas palustris]|uniref:Acetyltransferase n=1 Tax=Rhodopseudomonas palustris TaxID=1076 RepID=A0A0D7EWZ6_RHOPL|nr:MULTISPECIES: GNAT family N-acetyltransferase [Rhodopseudomonas]KIZ45075.1 acetyltransferase [Rhodopseudomonas palustris]MDF3812342.1 GNAT family N-acetyltransferase [Rhodopseudomonas sp. BAL398]